jgi:hypothetical protein
LRSNEGDRVQSAKQCNRGLKNITSVEIHTGGAGKQSSNQNYSMIINSILAEFCEEIMLFSLDLVVVL